MLETFGKTRFLIHASALLAFSTISGAAIAETRIVSITTDKADVKIEAVYFQGTRLKEVGRSDSRVFVEVGREGESFICRRSLAFRLSNGKELRKTADLCATNYQIDVAVADALRIERKTVMIEVDDGSEISEVRFDGISQTIIRRAGGTVFVEAEGNTSAGGYIECRRNIKLVLKDGRIIEKREDICGDNKVFIAAAALAGQDKTAQATRPPVRQAIPSERGPSAPPIGAPARPLPQRPDQSREATEAPDTNPTPDRSTADTTTSTAATEPDRIPADGANLRRYENKTWRTEGGSATDKTVTLVYGVPETDDTAFFASCQAGSNETEITLVEAVQGLREGAAIEVRLAALDEVRRFQATGGPVDDETGQSYPAFSIPAGDALWDDLIRGEELSVAIGGEWRYTVSLKGSAAPVRRFQAICAPPQQIVEPSSGTAPAYGGQPTDVAGGTSCADEGTIRSVPSDRPAALIFRNERLQPVIVNWIDFTGNRRFQADLQPGEEIRQPTLVGHPWLVSTPRGGCIGIYLPGEPSNLVTLYPDTPQAPRPVPPIAEAPLYDAPIYDPPQGVTRAVTDVSFDCEGGTQLDVTFDEFRSIAVVREVGLSPVTLREIPAGRGYHYALRGYELSGGQNGAVWRRPGARAKQCQAF